jgi:hypothetical protein
MGHMGSVAMGSGGGYWFKGGGGAYVGITEKCIYCDRCGSFKVWKWITLQIAILISAAALIVAVLWMVGQLKGLLVGLICLLLSSLWIFGAGVIKTGYICKQCGNTHISTGNVLQYPEYDQSILDLPYKKAVKIYEEDYEG